MPGSEVARRFVDALNAFDGDAVAALLTADFAFTIGLHTMDRDEFLASLATGPESDPEFRFAVDAIDGTEIHGRQEYWWRESGELATSAARVMRLELSGEQVRRAVVSDPP